MNPSDTRPPSVRQSSLPLALRASLRFVVMAAAAVGTIHASHALVWAIIVRGGVIRVSDTAMFLLAMTPFLLGMATVFLLFDVLRIGPMMRELRECQSAGSGSR